MKTLSFFVQGDPVAQPRPRATVRGKHAGIYNPDTADFWKKLITEKANIVARLQRWIPPDPHCPIRCDCRFYFERPLSHYVGNDRNRQLKKGAPIYHVKKPDRDNLDKAVLDALTKSGIWHDDAQAQSGFVARFWADNAPGVQIDIKEIEIPTP